MTLIVDNRSIVKFCATLTYTSGLVTHFAAILPTSIKYAFYGVSLIAGWLAIIIGRNSCENKKICQYSDIWFIFVVGLIILGAMRSDFFTDGFDLNIFLAQDLRFVTFVGIGIILADKNYWDSYVKIIYFVSAIAIIMGIIALTQYNFSYAGAEEGQRLGLWDLPYYLWWASGSVFSFVYSYSRIMRKNRLVGYGAFLTYAILGLLFIKRASFVNVFVCIVITEFLMPHKDTSRKFSIGTVVKLFVIIGIGLYILYSVPYTRALVDAMIERFSSQGGFLEYDRAREASAYFATTGISDIALGQGIGHYVSTSRLINALHTGLYNLVYKGGIVFIVIYVYYVVRILKSFVYRKTLDSVEIACLCVGVSYFVSMFYEASWSYTIYMMQYVTPIVALLTGALHNNGDCDYMRDRFYG